jgi:signal transduction histidine kinase
MLDIEVFRRRSPSTLRWPIRNQILVPFVAVVLLAVVGMTAVAAVVAARQRDAQTLEHLQNVVGTLARMSVPYTTSVLNSMRGLSGAHFVACDAQGDVLASTLPADARLPSGLDQAAPESDLTSLGHQPTIELGGTRYFLVRMEPRGDAQVRALFVLYPEASWSRARWNAALPPLVVGGGAVLLTAAVSGWLAQRFSRRLRRLQGQVAAIAAGDFREIRVGARLDELQELVVSVNSMATQLRAMQDAIRRSERTRLLAQVAGGLAHQLRNAVTGARMALQLHQRRCGSATEDKSLPVALRQLALMETQVRGLLSLGRGERSAPIVVELNELFDEVAGLVQPACEHAGVALHVSETHEPSFVRADLESLRAAVLNLVTNALEAAGPGGEVALRTARSGLQVSLEVEDTGAGPPADVADALFEPFVTSKQEGVGLGLALARQVALDHAGSLSWSRERGRTIFRLVLPAVAEPTETTAVPQTLTGSAASALL